MLAPISMFLRWQLLYNTAMTLLLDSPSHPVLTALTLYSHSLSRSWSDRLISLSMAIPASDQGPEGRSRGWIL